MSKPLCPAKTTDLALCQTLPAAGIILIGIKLECMILLYAKLPAAGIILFGPSCVLLRHMTATADPYRQWSNLPMLRIPCAKEMECACKTLSRSLALKVPGPLSQLHPCLSPSYPLTLLKLQVIRILIPQRGAFNNLAVHKSLNQNLKIKK